MGMSPLTKSAKYLGPHHWFLAAAAVWCLYLGVGEIWQRLMIEIEGIIVSSEPTTGNRPMTTYLLRGNNGAEQHYLAGATDAYLPRRLPEGTQIEKRRLELLWRRNGVTVNDFPLTFYLVWCAVGIALALWACMQWRLNRPNNLPGGPGTHA